MTESFFEPSNLKNPDILKSKPDLIICSNHRIMTKTKKDVCRWWDSGKLGTAISNGEGWYKPVK